MNSALRNKKVIKLLLLSMLGVLSGCLASPIEIHFMRRITGSDSLASYAFTIATIASILGVLFLARLANKIGRKKIIYWAYFFNILLPFYFSTVFSTLQLYGVKFTWSFIMAGAGTLIGAFIQQEVTSFQEVSGKFYGIMYAAQAGAGSVGFIIGGMISDAFGMTSVYYAVLLINIIQFLLIVSLVKGNQDNQNNEVKEEKKPGSIIEGVKFIWNNSELRARFILVTSFGINWSTKAILYPIIIFSVAGSNTSTAVIMATQGIVAMIVLPLIGHIVDKRGYAGVLVIGYIILGCAIITFGISPYLWLIWAAAAFVAVGEASNGPAMSTLEVKNIPDYLRNSVVAVHNAYGSIVAVTATFGIGLLMSYFKPQTIMIFLGAAVLASIIAAEASMKIRVKETIDSNFSL